MSGHDLYCWTCHKDEVNHSCNTCVRSFHSGCLTALELDVPTDDKFVCGECQIISEFAQKPLIGMRSLSREELNRLLLRVVREFKCPAYRSFEVPVNLDDYPDYKDKIVHPMSFQDLEKKCSDNLFTSPQELISDMMWIYHNTSVYNGPHDLTTNARQLLKSAAFQVADLELCPSCFENFLDNPDTWVRETCRKPHVLIMARVSGHPSWPAKLMEINQQPNIVEVRFFGPKHEMAFVNSDSCFLLTEKDCKPGKASKNMEAAKKELREHISKLEARFNFKYPFAPPKTPIDPRKLYIRVRDDEPEDQLSDVEPDAAGQPQPPDSPDEVPIQMDEGEDTEVETSSSKSGSAGGDFEELQQKGDATPVSPLPVDPVRNSGPPVAENGVVSSSGDADIISELEAQIANMQRELEEKRKKLAEATGRGFSSP